MLLTVNLKEGKGGNVTPTVQISKLRPTATLSGLLDETAASLEGTEGLTLRGAHRKVSGRGSNVSLQNRILKRGFSGKDVVMKY